MRKKILKNILPLLLILFLAGCDDYFDTDPGNIIDTGDYIDSQSEMYSGYLGIITKMQAVGDQSVFLTDTRADFLEPTSNAPQELWEIYNYGSTDGNSFADPAGYYAVIIACNDYFEKMFAYREEAGEEMDESTETNFKALVSGALRIKAWAYLTLGKIYGEAVYFDDAVTEMQDLSDNNTFTLLSSLGAIVEKCFTLIDEGMNGIDGTLSMEWGTWLDPEDPDNSVYVAWDYITPDYLCLRSELCLLAGTDYAWVREQILQLLYNTFLEDGYKYRLNAGLTGNYYRIFAQGSYYSRETIASIVYDYSNNQTNRLITYFGKRSPAEYLLRPSTYAMNKYGEDDVRGDGCYFTSQDGDTVMTKYHSNYRWRQPYQSDASIPLQRAHDLHFMLAEAENHLGNWDQAATLLNNGVYGRFPSLTVDTSQDGWDVRYQGFLDNASYPNTGICGCVNATQHTLPQPTDAGYDLTEEERIRIYDMALLDEMLLEYAAEGRAYGMMIRMAQRYNDYSIIADRVCPKYSASQQDAVRSAIMSGGYFVDWNLGQ